MTPGAHALRHGAGVVALDDAVWVVTGSQARDFLHRMLTQDVRSIAPMEARRACLLDVRGRVLLDLLVQQVPGMAFDASHPPTSSEPRAPSRSGPPPAFALVANREAGERAMPVLERYVIADDVVIRREDRPHAQWWVVGDRAAQVVGDDGGAVAEHRTNGLRLGGLPVMAFRRDLGTRPGYRLRAWPGTEAGVLAALRDQGAVEATSADFDQARVETGTPWWGSEIDERVMPTEAGLADAVSFTKGCYLGQEPVTMSKHRGHPPTLLGRFTLDGTPPPPGALLLEGDRRVGRLTTAVPGAALGYVAFAFAKVGASFRAEGGDAPATVERILA